jgi:palmitoyltransferase
MSVLAYYLHIRVMVIWNNRGLPAYLGPPVWALAHLMVLCIVNGFTLFALLLLLVQSGRSLLTNTTMIESWEVERHETLVARARKQGGFVYASGGYRVRVEQQEFPYDIGFWKNLCQAMGTTYIFMWALPFGGGPGIGSAGTWEVNGFEDEDKVWPPPDPDKITRRGRPSSEQNPREYGTIDEEREAFKKRQEKDYQRWQAKDKNEESSNDEDHDVYEVDDEGIDGEEGWTNSDGDRLRDYGVDEEAEEISDDDIPLGELLRRRKARVFV